MLSSCRLLPLVALLVGGVVGMQALDLFGCPDERVGQHETGAAAGHGADADCLCHLTFLDTALGAALRQRAGFSAPPHAAAPEGCDAGVRRRVERPPIG